MKRLVYFLAVILTALAAGQTVLAQAQPPLGDYARAAKKAKNSTAPKRAAKVYDNDTLPKATSISVVGDSSAPVSGDANSSASDKNPDGTPKPDAGATEKKKEPEIKPGQSSDERQKALDAWKDKLAGQQEKINRLSHEMELAQREYQVKSTEFWENTAERAQNPNGFREQDEKYKQEIAGKQKQLDDEKTKLGDMQDEARKAGAPSSIIETDSGSEKNENN